MSFDAQQVLEAVTPDPAWAQALRGGWLRLMELAVFGDLRSTKIGAAGKLRKRLLEAGERLRSLPAPREWIRHPREQLKNAPGSALALREGLGLARRAAADMDVGGELAQFAALLDAFEADLERGPGPRVNRWAELLESQYVAERGGP